MECQICAQLETGVRFPIHKGEAWVIEHTSNPTAVAGWLRLVLHRHAEALHELTPEEWQEMNTLMAAAAKALHSEFQTDKEYVMCFAEGEGTRHLHLHLVPKSADLPSEKHGANIFSLLNVSENEAISTDEIKATVERLSQHINFS